MRRKLFVIDGVFNITGRGIVVTGERESDFPAFKIGSTVVLIQPNGEEFITKIVGIDISKPIDYKTFNRNKIGVLFEDNVSKKDVPIGTELFLLEE